MSVRRRMKTGVARALSWTAADALIGSLMQPKVLPTIVGYHRVVEDYDAASRRTIPAMLTSRRTLERHLDWLGLRFRFVSLNELDARLERNGADGTPCVAVTFDDGYRDVYEHAFPLLERKGIPATVFVATDFVGTSELLIHDKLYLLLARAIAKWRDPEQTLSGLLAKLGTELPESGGGLASAPSLATATLLRALPQPEIRRVLEVVEAEVGLDREAAREMAPLTWSMLAEMGRAGITVGSHTKSHAWLTREGHARAAEEIQGSRHELERRLGVRVRHFAYPDGRFNAATLALVAMSGYRFGYTTCAHRDHRYPLLTIPRRLLWESSCVDALGRFSPEVMSCQVRGVFDMVRRCEQDHATGEG